MTFTNQPKPIGYSNPTLVQTPGWKLLLREEVFAGFQTPPDPLLAADHGSPPAITTLEIVTDKNNGFQ